MCYTLVEIENIFVIILSVISLPWEQKPQVVKTKHHFQTMWNKFYPPCFGNNHLWKDWLNLFYFCQKEQTLSLVSFWQWRKVTRKVVKNTLKINDLKLKSLLMFPVIRRSSKNNKPLSLIGKEECVTLLRTWKIKYNLNHPRGRYFQQGLIQSCCLPLGDSYHQSDRKNFKKLKKNQLCAVSN